MKEIRAAVKAFLKTCRGMSIEAREHISALRQLHKFIPHNEERTKEVFEIATRLLHREIRKGATLERIKLELDMDDLRAQKMMELGEEAFVCSSCGGVFRKAWADAEANAERKANGFEEIPCDLVCDDCFKRLYGWLNSEDIGKQEWKP